MIRQLYEKTIWTLACVVLIALGLAMGGCDSEVVDTAEAADRRIVETFVIEPESFVLRTDLTPTIETTDGTTKYTLTSDGTITFTPTTDIARIINLVTDEIVIERPPSGTLTLIRFR